MRKTVLTGGLIVATMLGMSTVAFCEDPAGAEVSLVPAAQEETEIREDEGKPDADEMEKKMAAEFVRLTPKEQAGRWAKRLDDMERQKDYAGLRSSAVAFTRWLESVKGKEPEVYKNHIVQAYTSNAAGLNGQGYYMVAANTIRNGYEAGKAAGANVGSLVELASRYDVRKETRNEYYKAIRNHQNAVAKIEQDVLDMTTQKQKMVDELLQSTKKITPEALKDLQGRIKALNEKIAAGRKEIEKENAAHKKLLDDKKYDGIILNPQLTANVEAADKAQQKTQGQIRDGEAAVRKGLLALAEKAEHSWQGLSDRINKLTAQQKEISALQKELLDMLAKKPYSEDAKKRIRALNEKLDKLSAEMAKNLDGVEEDFMNAGTFNALDPKQMIAFREQLAALLKAETAIGQENARIDEQIAAMEKETAKLGDVNGDGKIDRKDLAKLVLHLGRKASTLANADLDGDGRITISDFQFLRDAVFGGRTVFPADPKYIPGDLDGNGQLGWADLLKLAQVVQRAGRNGIKVSSPWLAQYDINGDKVINNEDFQALVKNITQPPVIDKPAVEAASATEAAVATGASTTPADTATGTTVETGASPQETAQPAGSMGDN
ncbi:MAG: EF hand [bacterium ADurb.Bin374]|nr:MAG: EF hand [bacterium ADurb.Bin374]